jgi:hypothetical protein
MNTDEATRMLLAAIKVTRDDIARAKAWLVEQVGGATHELVDEWLAAQKMTVPLNSKVNLMIDNGSDQVTTFARAFSIRLAFYQAQWELIGAGELFPSGSTDEWQASLGFSHYGQSGGLDVKGIRCSYPQRVMRPPLAPSPTTDPDIFLKGVNCKTLHTGILEAVKQALSCFGRGLYMPATAMLAAAAEATWTECGVAVAKKLSDARLDAIVGDPYASISKKVSEIQKAFRTADGKALAKSAGRSLADLDNAEIWTTNLRERRNALHWDKAKSFIADHAETASLLMGAPLHLGTLETIRVLC